MSLGTLGSSKFRVIPYITAPTLARNVGTTTLGWRALKTPTAETPGFYGHVTMLTLQYFWPRPPGVWLGGPGCKPGHSGWSWWSPTTKIASGLIPVMSVSPTLFCHAVTVKSLNVRRPWLLVWLALAQNTNVGHLAHKFVAKLWYFEVTTRNNQDWSEPTWRIYWRPYLTSNN